MNTKMKLIALIAGLAFGSVQASEVGTYPNASVLAGTERILGDQASITVDITPAQIATYLANNGLTATGSNNVIIVSAGHTTQINDNYNGLAQLSITNAGTGNALNAGWSLNTGTASSFLSETLFDNSGAPQIFTTAGSAITRWYLKEAEFTWQNQAGSTTYFDLSSTLLTSGLPSTFSNATIKLSGIASSTAAQTGTVCYGTGGLLTYDPTNTCLASAGRFKENIQPLDTGLKELLELKPVSYKWKQDQEYGPANFNNDAPQVGFIAEDVAKVDPRLVTFDLDGQLHSVRYLQMTALLAKGVQEFHSDYEISVSQLTAEIHTQQMEINLLVFLLVCSFGFTVYRTRK